MRHDLRAAWRRVRRGPAAALAVTGLLALAMALVTCVFSVVYGMVWKPLPFPGESQLLQLTSRSTRMGMDLGWSLPYLDAVARDSRELDVVAGYRREQLAETDADGRYLGDLQALHVDPALLSMLGAHPARGRLLSVDDTHKGSEPVALIGAGYWHSRFDGADGALDTSLHLAGKTYRLVGILPAGFAFPDRSVQVVLPLGFTAEERAVDNAGSFGDLRAIGRLRAGSTREAAAAEMMRITQGDPVLAWVADQIGLQLQAKPLREVWLAGRSDSLLAMLAAVALVFAAVVANAYNLFVLRLVRRRQEFAVQEAIGASAQRRVVQVGFEAALLAGAAALLALAATPAGVALLGHYDVLPAGTPQRIGVDGASLLALATMWVVATAALGSGALALRLRHTFEVLRQTGNGQTAGGAVQRLRKVLVIAQLVAALLLLYATLLLARSAHRLLDTDLGFDRGGTLVASLQPASDLDADPVAVRGRVAEFVAALGGRPGVTAVGLTTSAPFSRNVTLEAYQAGERKAAEDDDPKAYIAHVSEGYPQALGLRLLRGRPFTAAEAAAATPVVLIDQQLAARHFGDRDPLGASIRVSGSSDGGFRDVRVVGVVGNVRQRVLHDADTYPTIYRPAQTPYAVDGVPLDSVELVVGSERPAALLPELERLLQQVAPTLRLADALSMERRVTDTIADSLRLNALLQILCALTLLLTAVGLYALLAHAVATRQREFGIRQAIGASAAHLRRDVLAQGGRLLGVALLIGAPLAVALGFLLRSQLHEVAAVDPLLLAAAAALLLLLGLLANYLPARRAAQVKPSEALRYD